MAIDANGNTFNIPEGRVRYDLLTDALYDTGTPDSTLKHKGPAPELIKIALATGIEATFFGAAPTYTPIYFDSELLNEVYGNQIFLDVDDQKNFVWLSEAVTGTCLNEMNDFIKFTPVFLESDIPGVDIDDGYIPTGKEELQ